VVDATIAALSPIVADMVRLHRLLGCRPGAERNEELGKHLLGKRDSSTIKAWVWSPTYSVVV